MPMGTLFVIAAPSGAGKTTLVKSLVESLFDITVSISHTTRPKRPNETDGINYHFVDKETFQEMIGHQDFLEHATVFGHFYGTSKKWVNETLAKGTDVILEIDWQGHQQIRQIFEKAVSIFILPPSLRDLEERLVKRNQDEPGIIELRLKDAKETVSHVAEFDYLVVNDNFSQAVNDLHAIVEASRLTTLRQAEKYGALIQALIK